MKCECDPYLGHVSEKLVLEGYRHWCKSRITGDCSQFRNAWQIYAEILNGEEATFALNSLTTFTKVLGSYSRCPLKTSPVGCHSLCRDEILILGLLSGIQHDDQTAITLCLDGLNCPSRCDEVLIAAETLATTLRALDKTLLPIPAHTIKAILVQDTSTTTLQ